jgi:hypothetical protein
MWLRQTAGGTNRRPILKSEIEEAQRNTKTANEAARWLGCSYRTYKKYAELYGIHQQHLNPGGKGIAKAHFESKRVPLAEIFAGKHKGYNLDRLKTRMIQSGYLDEKCYVCGFNERRITDYRMPLMLVFKDPSAENRFEPSNIQLMCYNCVFLTVGELNKVNAVKVQKMANAKADIALGSEVDASDLSPEQLNNIIKEAREELGVVPEKNDEV